MIGLLKQLFSWTKYIQPLAATIAIALIASQMAVLPALATGVYEMPMLSAGDRTWVWDKGDVLSRSSESTITSVLDNLETQTGKQVRFVTIHRLDYGETTATFTKQLFEQWFPATEDQTNQILLVLDTVTNSAAIRTGEGVKSLLTDDIAQSVAGETVQVPLREGNKYNEAFTAASDRIATVLSGQPDPGAPEVVDNTQVEGTFKKAEETDRGNATVIVVVLLVLATVIPMVTYFWYQGFS
ncbi:beta-propeller domain-containing protein, methanol dehydrogenase [Tychonema bourrellyi FEM_GT703]|uniref:Beta-propeller domain-containing protein, methanol dehydrogenase n=1 Tax=Tychonema bourrellyi FEM_GT703 TaxID=2040638 RepID=A0A2G4F033_9CYAN|nr:TPM domain-containing protein [Tychonema bourrellyi]PHX55116.1 beta-propeller domain-containing protein, methanol dehydrogenase [Tychonema bourrellyi FEM_GT703]